MHTAINLTKEEKDLHNSENLKTPRKEMKEDAKRWKILPCSWAGRIHTVETTVLWKLSYRFSVIPIKILMTFMTEIHVLKPKINTSHRKPHIAKAILNRNSNARDTITSGFKLYYRVIVTKTAWYQHKNRCVDQWNKIEHPKISPHSHKHSWFCWCLVGFVLFCWVLKLSFIL